MALPSLTAQITIDGGDMVMNITGNVAIYIDAVTLTGKVSFMFPCQPGGSNFVELGIAIDSDAIKLDHAMVRGQWMCPGGDWQTYRSPVIDTHVEPSFLELLIGIR